MAGYSLHNKKSFSHFQEKDFYKGHNLQYLSIFCPMTFRLSSQNLRERMWMREDQSGSDSRFSLSAARCPPRFESINGEENSGKSE